MMGLSADSLVEALEVDPLSKTRLQIKQGWMMFVDWFLDENITMYVGQAGKAQ